MNMFEEEEKMLIDDNIVDGIFKEEKGNLTSYTESIKKADPTHLIDDDTEPKRLDIREITINIIIIGANTIPIILPRHPPCP
jgi:hypothetical protein